MRVRIMFLIVGLGLAASAPALAGGKGGGGRPAAGQHPQESISLNYGKTEQTYKIQNQSGGAARHSGGTITHRKAGKGQMD
jgi:hypothetical protein